MALPESARMRAWRTNARPPHSRPTTLGRALAEQLPFSASTAPEQAVLPMHLFQERADAPKDVLAALVTAGIVAQNHCSQMQRLVGAASATEDMARLLQRFGQWEGHRTDGPALAPSSLTRPTPFGVFTYLHHAWRNLRPFAEKTPEDADYVSNIIDAPRTQRSVVIEQPEERLAGPDFAANRPYAPSPERRSVRMTAQEMQEVLDADTPVRRGVGRPNRPTLSSLSYPLPPPQGHLVPLNVALQTSIPERLREPSRIDTASPSTPPQPPVSDYGAPPQLRQEPLLKSKAPFEVLSSHFCGGYFGTYPLTVLTDDLGQHSHFMPQEKGYRFGQDRDKKYLFEARPDGAFLSKNRKGEMVPFAWAELKPVRRRTSLLRTRREEACQFVAIRDVEHRREQDRVVLQDFPDVPNSSQDEPERLVRPAARTETSAAKHTKFWFALNHDEFYLNVATYNDRYVEYISNLDSIVCDESTSEADFAIIKENGPFKISRPEDMHFFNEVYIAIQIAQLDKSDEGRTLLDELEHGLTILHAPLSTQEDEEMRRTLGADRVNKHMHTREGKTLLRRRYGEYVQDLL
jgi:hypothetical protein